MSVVYVSLKVINKSNFFVDELLSKVRQVNLTTEVDHGDDFDYSLLGDLVTDHSDHSSELSEGECLC